MEWYPQYWGPGKQGDFESQVAAGAIRPGMTILGYNEPDQPGQANLGIQDGINSYLAQITPYADQGYRLATPGCTSDDKGLAWIKGFVEGCAGRCKFSVLQTHYYGTDADAFIAYIQNLYDLYHLPIIVSEYSAATFGNGQPLSLGETHAYVEKTQSWREFLPHQFQSLSNSMLTRSLLLSFSQGPIVRRVILLLWPRNIWRYGWCRTHQPNDYG